jgi:S-(hydroxymethyl)glutathione dehydrogenase/alcohol dehydrogenase
MTTRAAILVQSHQPLVVDEIELPTLGVGQVLVKVHVAGICGAQLGEIAAVKGPDKFLPHLLGHEGGGVVEDIGPGVTHVKVGDPVCLHWRKGNGIHAQPARYRWHGQTVNAGWVTTFSDRTVVSENRLTPIPPGTPFEIAALMGCAVTTALGLINNDARLKIGQSIAIFGCGGVGLNVVQAAAMVAGHPIIAIDRYDSKRQFASRFGATHTLNSTTADLRADIRAIAGPQGVDVAVETTGNVRLIELAYELTAPQGRTVLVGVPRHDQDITIHSLPLHFGKVLTGCEGGQSQPALDIPRYLRLYQAGKLKLDDLITHRFPLERINDALETVRGGEAGRVILQMS